MKKNRFWRTRVTYYKIVLIPILGSAFFIFMPTALSNSGANGVCILRTSGTSLPMSYSAAEYGTGYVKINKPGVTTITDIRASCTDSDFSTLQTGFCSLNPGSSAQKEVVIYDTSGNYYSNGCADGQSCQNITCSTSSSSSSGSGSGGTSSSGSTGGSASGTSSSDTSPPTAPGNVTVGAVSATQINISWNAATDNTAVTSYKIYLGGTLYTSISASSTNFSFNNLAPTSNYTFYVIAVDAAGNQSPPSNLVYASTPVSGATETVSGACILRNSYTNMPKASYPNAGTGYAKLHKPGINTISGLQTACGSADFQNLLQTYCASNTGQVQQQVVTYDSTGNVQSTSCGAFGCNYVSCPTGSGNTTTTTTTPTITVTPTPTPTPTPTVAPSPTPAGLFNITSWGMSVQTGTTTIGIAFSNALDAGTINSGNAYLLRLKDNSQVPAMVKSQSAYLFIYPSIPLNAGESYKNIIKSAIKNSAGVSLSADYTCQFTALAGGYYQSCPNNASSTIAILTPKISRLSGKITDSSNSAVAAASVHVYKTDYSFNQGTVSALDGTYSLNLPEGYYLIDVIPPLNRTDLFKTVPAPLTITGEQNITLNLRFETFQTNQSISGTIMFSDNNPVTDAKVGAYNESSGKWAETTTDSRGKYYLNLGPGTWKVAFRPINQETAVWQWLGSYASVTFDKTSASEEKIMDFTVPVAESTITVSALDDQKQPLSGAGIAIEDKNSPQNSQFKKTDALGQVIFNVKAGEYLVKAYISEEAKLIAPDPQTVKVDASNKAGLAFIFKTPQINSTQNISGQIKDSDGLAADQAIVWAWSEQGGTAKSESGPNGNFIISLTTGQRWHIGAAKEIGGLAYKSSEQILEEGQTTLEITLLPIKAAPIAAPVIISKLANQPIIATATDGATVNMPAGAAGQSGTVNLEFKATVEAPSRQNAQLVGAAYDITIKDTGGQKITQLNSDIALELPYSPEALKKLGVKAKALIPSYYDETSGQWVKLDSYSLDLSRNVIVARVNHLTRFALVAPADVTPPVAPINLQGARSGKTEVTVIWADPAIDFHHSKIYRSTNKKQLGELVAPLITNSIFKDASVSLNKTYYYKVVSVDTAGNESEFSQQLAVRVSGRIRQISPQAPPRYFTKYLSKGRKGPEVKFLQQILLDQDFYRGEINGIFNQETVSAVKDFQGAKGLKATGVLDLRTRDALNKA